MAIMADIMMATSVLSSELKSIIDSLNDIFFEYPTETEERHYAIIEYFKENEIVIRIPCMIIAEEEYTDTETLLNSIKDRCAKAFEDFTENNDSKLDIEIMLMVFPVRDLRKLRQEFLDERTCEKGDRA